MRDRGAQLQDLFADPQSVAELQPEPVEDEPHPAQRFLRVPFRPAEHDQIVGLCRVPSYAEWTCDRRSCQGLRSRSSA